MISSSKHDLLTHVEGASDVDFGPEDARSCSQRSYDKVVNQLIPTYTENSKIVATESVITTLRKNENKVALYFKDFIFSKRSRRGKFYTYDTHIQLSPQRLNHSVEYHDLKYYYEVNHLFVLYTCKWDRPQDRWQSIYHQGPLRI